MKTEHLFEFIKALDKGAVRHCRSALEKELGKPAKDRLNLFNTLHSVAIFDEKLLLKRLRRRKIIQNFEAEKSRLYDQLVQTVSTLHRMRRSRTDPRNQAKESGVLMELGLYNRAVKVLNKGIGQAVELEELFLEVQLREQLRKCYKNLSRKQFEQPITQNEYLLQTASRKLNRLISYTEINDRMLDYHKKHRISSSKQLKESIEELMARPEMKDVKKADSLPSQLRYHYIWSFYHVFNKDYPAAVESKKTVVQLWETKPQRIDVYPHLYRSAISNLLGTMAIMGDLEEIQYYLEKMEGVETRNRKDQVLKFKNLELQYSLYYMNTGNLDKALAREDGILSGLRKFKGLLQDSTRISFLYNLGVTHLVADNPGNALNYFDRIRQLGKLNERQDLQGVARLLRLLLLCEDDSTGSFKHYLRNSQRFFKETDRQYTLENGVYDWLQRHHKLAEKDARRTSFKQLADMIQPLAKQKILGAEEILFWATAKKNGTPVRKVFNEQLAKQSA